MTGLVRGWGFAFPQEGFMVGSQSQWSVVSRQWSVVGGRGGEKPAPEGAVEFGTHPAWLKRCPDAKFGAAGASLNRSGA